MNDLLQFLMSYETLRAVWWLFLGVLLAGFAITDGFDLGVGMLLPVLAKSDEERRVLINVVGPTWDGNQVWLILGAGAVFAAFPPIYATAFSGFFIALLLVLFALILRPVGFEYRSKIADPRWRATWDWGIFIAGFVPTLVIGVAFGNLLQGVPFRFDADLRSFYEGHFFQLLNPFALLVGGVSIAMLAMHGAIYLQLKTVGSLQARARFTAIIAALALAATFTLAGVFVAGMIDGFIVTGGLAHDGPSNPLLKTVTRSPGAWMANFGTLPALWLLPVLGIVGALATAWLAARNRPGLGFITSALSLTMVIFTVGAAMFPFLMPSSLNPNHSLTVWDASSSLLTLRWMFWMVLLFLPLILVYTGWVYSKLRGPVTVEQIKASQGHFY
jgi:cytochrome d ubiquinol oxidase subunit II